MRVHVFHAYVMAAHLAFLSLAPAVINVSFVIRVFNHLLTILARLRSRETLLFMRLQVFLIELYLTVLTYCLGMCFTVMFFSFGFGYDIAANWTLVVVSSATDFVDTELRQFDITRASPAFLSRDRAFSFLICYLVIHSWEMKSLKYYKRI